MDTLTLVLLVATLAAVLGVGLLMLLLLTRSRSGDAAAEALVAQLEQRLADTRRETSAELDRQGDRTREAIAQSSLDMQERLQRNLAEGRKETTETLSRVTTQLEGRFEKLQGSNEQRLIALQQDNAAKLDQMRAVVEEKLHKTLETRLGESFKQVSDRLEQVHKGLGEMQALAGDVGDLKRVMTNVKTRGTWGEVQLGNLLEQVLTAEQYAENAEMKPGSRERVEFAIRLPGRSGDEADDVWLPIDAKFPQEDYQRLLEAQERADPVAAEAAVKQLEARVKRFAADIRDKYVNPPRTTDFALMYLPSEGLYAEVLRRPGLVDSLQREYRVVPAGPTTLWAQLNSLQMGFRTLAIEKRSSEVWKLLGAVKAEFGKFGGILERVQKQIQTVSNTMETASRKTRTIERKLRQVEQMPTDEAAGLLDMADDAGAESDEDEDSEE